MEASGSIYELKKVEEYTGVYGQVRLGWAVGEKISDKLWLENMNGIVMTLKAKRKGLALALGTDGIVIEMKE